MNKRVLKIWSVKLLKFILIFLLVDLVFGTISKELFFNQKTGKFARSTFVIEKTEAEVLIFGSSHAIRNYVPDILGKQLGLSCYNAGAEGQKLMYQTALQKMTLKRLKPKLIILNLDPDWLFKSEVAYDRLSDLHPYYDDHRDVLLPILSLRSKLVDFKLFFKSYQTNSTLVHMLRYYVSPQTDYSGYRPLNGKMNPNKGIENNQEQELEYDSSGIDENFVTAFKSFITNAKQHGVAIVLVTSPTPDYSNSGISSSMTTLTKIANDEQIRFVSYLNDPEFEGKYELFHDASHLNQDGAELFTSLVAGWIKDQEMLKKQ